MIPCPLKGDTRRRRRGLLSGTKDCPEIEESCRIEVSEDNLQAIVRFYPASQTGKRATMDSVIKDLRFRNIVYGIQMSVLQDHLCLTEFIAPIW